MVVTAIPSLSTSTAYIGRDVFADRRQILSIDSSDINITAIDDQLDID